MQKTAIRKRREASGLSLREVARRVGMAPQQLSRIEQGRSSATIARLYAIAAVLGDDETARALAPFTTTQQGVR